MSATLNMKVFRIQLGTCIALGEGGGGGGQSNHEKKKKTTCK